MNPTKLNLPREDLRARRTKRYLSVALVALMEERPFSEISVVDICDRAMVHRTTFYTHFEDKYTLLRFAVTELYQTFAPATRDVEQSTPQANFLTLFKNALAFMREHQGLYRSAASSGGVDLQILEDLVAEKLCETLSETKLPDQLTSLHPDITAHFYAGAILSMIRWWLENGMPVEDEVLLVYAERLVFHR